MDRKARSGVLFCPSITAVMASAVTHVTGEPRWLICGTQIKETPRSRVEPWRCSTGQRNPGSVVGEAKLRRQAGVIEGPGELSASFAEVGPAVVVGRDDHGGLQDRGRGGGPDAVQCQRASP